MAHPVTDGSSLGGVCRRRCIYPGAFGTLTYRAFVLKHPVILQIMEDVIFLGETLCQLLPKLGQRRSLGHTDLQEVRQERKKVCVASETDYVNAPAVIWACND